ncbi:TetR/AcrR family transcriptional regulator [Aeromicrobium phragmitis]|uniref:TetR/AcrR family transcriptional regulator n=1 Tax=Aeromicrobium phragmitis TaxID=2478914 RepID=A0A3L8PKU5_9ACTN|nr:TetR/AcrR family transcriptional regulator [Aeromicrobium phragmitis]
MGRVGLEAFQLARRIFLAGEKVDVGALATELAVDRTTLFRWVGNRDQLLEEVIRSLNVASWRRALSLVPGAGPARVAGVLSVWIEDVATAEFFRSYLRREGTRALRLLTTSDGLHQARVVDDIERLLVTDLEESEEAGTPWTPPMEVHDLAYVVCRIAESFVYSDLITGEEPEPRKAATAIGAILGLRLQSGSALDPCMFFAPRG